MLDMITLNPDQDKMLSAALELHEACEKKAAADLVQWENRNCHEKHKAFQPEWEKAFKERTEKRKEFYRLVNESPNLAADLIERLIRKLN